ncbi:MAG: hypothetical protein AB7P97_20940, partial [Hyphomonadaceae bacterium]
EMPIWISTNPAKAQANPFIRRLLAADFDPCASAPPTQAVCRRSVAAPHWTRRANPPMCRRFAVLRAAG